MDIIYLTIFGKYKTPVNSLFPYFISIAAYSVLHFQNHTTFIEALITRIYTCTIILKLLKGVAMKISEMKKLLKKNGCFYVRELNGHEDWYSPITKKHFPIPRLNSQELGTGIENAIKKQAGIK